MNNNDILLNNSVLNSVYRVSNKREYFVTIPKHNLAIYNLNYIILYFIYMIFINRLRIFIQFKHNRILN